MLAEQEIIKHLEVACLDRQVTLAMDLIPKIDARLEPGYREKALKTLPGFVDAARASLFIQTCVN